MKAIRVENPGPDCRLVLGDIPKPAPTAGEVLIRITAAGINRADLHQAAGNYPPPSGSPDTLGLEVSGEIVELGGGINSLRVGEKVCALLGGGGYAEYCIASEKCVLPVPANVDLIEAAALPEVHFTVWTNLMDSGRLAPGESVLVHGGSSGIGTAAIQLCAARGHKVFTTAGGKDKCEACEKLGAARAINYREEDFVAVIKEQTNDKGVNVILDMVGGDYIEKNFRAAARLGRIVNIAFQNGSRAEVNFGIMMMKRVAMTATTLRTRSNDEKGAIRDAIAREVWPLVASGRIKPVVDKVFPLAEAQTAHARMAQSAHIGKILLAV